MQKLVLLFARIMARTCGTSGAESLSASANIFVGQTEAPLLIKPYVAGMTRSELLCVMTGRHGHRGRRRAGGLRGHAAATYPDIAGHLLAASVMSAPAALVMAKLLLPETERPQTMGVVELPYKDPSANVIEAAANGATTGLQLALNVGAMLVAFMSLLAMLNWGVGQVAGLVRTSRRALRDAAGLAFAPLAWLMGTPGVRVPRRRAPDGREDGAERVRGLRAPGRAARTAEPAAGT
jgi:CNT family concentrative nucleoside transporter